MSYSRENQETKEKEKCTPHPDVDENVRFYNRQMGQVEWLKPMDVSIHDTKEETIQRPDGTKTVEQMITEFKYALFLWHDEGGQLCTWNISFHMPNKQFRIDLCNALNNLGSRGWLTHKTLGSGSGSHPHADNWTKLFGGHSSMQGASKWS